LHDADLFYNVANLMNIMEKHLQALFLLIRSMVICGLLVLAQTAWCGQVDSEKIDLILRDLVIDKTNPYGSTTQGVMYDGLPGAMAIAQTRQLGAGVRDWNAENPKWKPVYDHIRTDLENDLPTLPAADAAAYAEYRRCEAGKCYTQDIASNLQPADIDAILAYFDTPEGKRFQTFQQQIDSIYISGLHPLKQRSLPQTAANSSNKGQDSQANSFPTSPEQMQRYLRMLNLSILVQSTKAIAGAAHSDKQDPSDNGLLFFMAAAMGRNKTKLEELDLQYRNDLPGFGAFNESDASQHFIEAMGKADAKEFRRIMFALKGLQDIVNTHQQEWKDLFKTELSQ